MGVRDSSASWLLFCSRFFPSVSCVPRCVTTGLRCPYISPPIAGPSHGSRQHDIIPRYCIFSPDAPVFTRSLPSVPTWELLGTGCRFPEMRL